MQDVETTVGIAGGTGALGRGLAGRLALAGVRVRLGSRDAQRGRTSAAELGAELPAGAAEVVGGGNAELDGCGIIVLAVPHDSLGPTLEVLAPFVAGRIVVSAVNPLGFDAQGPHTLPVEGGSVAEQVAARLPDARVVGAFHTVSSRQLARFDRPMDEDVPVVGDDEDAIGRLVELAGCIDGCRGVAAGPLRLAATLEAITAVLIAVNQRYGAHAGVRFTGLPTG